MVFRQMEWSDARRVPDVVSQKNLASGDNASGRGHSTVAGIKGS
jgi:hypothetical protein